MQSKTKRIAVLGTALAATTTLGGVGILTAANATDNTTSSRAEARADVVSGRLLPLNNSGASGHAKIKFDGDHAKVHVHAKNLAPNLPHAQHIHFGQQAMNECPSAAAAGDDHRLTTAEGIPDYGPVRTSLTTSGDTSAKSTLAVDRYPTAPDGKVHYKRIVPMKGEALAQAIKDGKGVVVIHGVDYNGNGTYDFSSGKSELDKSLPAEATDPAVCGVLMK
jgi:hypothetical protein